MIDYEARLPARMRALPRDSAGRPIPKFVDWIDGKEDFRIMSREHLARCVRHSMCWVCGQPLGANLVFVAGPMCLVNRISAEPPCHLDCAVYSATHCPFLGNPDKVRREAGLPEERHVSGVMIPRNPAVAALIVTRSYELWPPPQGGVLFHMGEPTFVQWYHRGAAATRAQVLESIESGRPILSESCAGDPRCLAALDEQVQAAMQWVPAE